MLTVHLRVNDAATNRPTPVRVRLVDAEGCYRAPLGRLAEFATGPGEDVGGQVLLEGRAHALIDGACEVRLPAGKVTVEVSKGPEYVPLRQEVLLAPGKVSLRLSIRRWADWRERGWYPGDIRAFDLSPHAALLEGAAEGLAVVQILARERPADDGRPAAVTNLLAFSGSREALRTEECLVAVNTLNEHPVLGSVALLHCHRPVFPLRSGTGGEHWSVADWCDQCHRKTGLVVWPVPSPLDPTSLQGEALAALVLGKVDACEVSSVSDPGFPEFFPWYRLLNAGARAALVGGSGKDSNAVVLGAVRTYAQLGEGQALDASTWVSAVRAGRTFATSGPLLSLEVAGQGPGGVVRVEPNQAIRVRAAAQSARQVRGLELIAGGELIARADTSAEVGADFAPAQSTWLAARCHAGPDGWAHTSPVWLDVPGRPTRATAATLDPLLDVLDRTAGWLGGHCDSERQREHIREVLRQAREVLLSRRAPEGAGP